MPKDLLLFPFGGSAREALIMILSHPDLRKEWNVLGFIDDDPALKDQECVGVRVLGGREILQQNSNAKVLAVPASPQTHLKRNAMINALGIEPSRFATIVHPSCIVSADARIGYNTVILPHGFISASTRIGNHCVILSKSTISHDTVVGDDCCLGVGVIVSGHVTIKDLCYIGSGVSIRENIIVHEKSFVGIGSNVVKDVPSGMVVAGNPARLMRENQP